MGRQHPIWVARHRDDGVDDSVRATASDTRDSKRTRSDEHGGGVEEVNSVFEKDPAGDRGVPEPVIDIEVLIGGVVVERETAHRRQDATLDQPHQRGQQWVVPQHVIDHVAPLVARHGFDDLLGFDGAQGSGLLAEDMLSCPGSSDRQRCVGVRRGRDDDSVDRRIGQQGIHGVEHVNVMAAREGERPVNGLISDGEQQHVVEPSEGIGDERGELSGADHSESHPSRRVVGGQPCRFGQGSQLRSRPAVTLPRAPPRFSDDGVHAGEKLPNDATRLRRGSRPADCRAPALGRVACEVLSWVAGEGFEPSKEYSGGFTVRSHWPLGQPAVAGTRVWRMVSRSEQ